MNYEVKTKSSGIYFVEFKENGQRRRVTLKTRDRTTAVARARSYFANPANVTALYPEPKAAPAGMTMAKLFDMCLATVWSPRECKSQQTIKSQVKILDELIGDVPVADMDYDRLTQLMLDLFKRGYAAATVKRKMEGVGKALSCACQWKDPATGRLIITGRPKLPPIKIENFQDRVVSHDEEALIFAEIERRVTAYPTGDWKRYAAFIRFLIYTGCRLSEALGITTDQLDQIGDNTYVHLERYTTKNGKPRIIPLANVIVADLEYLKLAAVDGKLFPFKAANAWYRWDTIRKSLIRAGGNETKLNEIVLHTFRHTCLTRLAKSGKLKIQDISLWAGHSNIQVTIDRYLHMLPEDKLHILDVINQH